MLTRAIIVKFCQKVKVTPNQDRIIPSNQVSSKMLPVVRTIAPTITPIAVDFFIIQTARAAEGISTISGDLLSSN